MMNNGSNYTVLNRDDDNSSSTILEYLGFAFVCVFGILGNLLVMLCIVCIQRLRCNTNMFLASLAFADMMFIVFGACIYPLIQSSLDSSASSADLRCKLANFTPFYVGICSSFNLAMVSIERFVAILFPFNVYFVFSKCRTVLMIVAIWEISALLALPEIYAWESRDSECRLKDAYNHILYPIYMNLLIVFLPFAIMIFCYFCICFKLFKREISIRTGLFKANLSSKNRTNIKVIQLLISVVFVFFICWSPITILSLFFTRGDTSMDEYPEKLKRVYFFFERLPYLNSCLNPIVYALLSTKFREGLRHVLKTLSRKK